MVIGLISSVVRDGVPSYLKSVPIPRSFGGFLELSAKEWLHLVAFSSAVGAAGYYIAKPYIDQCNKGKADKGMPINPAIKKDCKKVVDVVDIESLGEKVSYCRCWRSKKFPYCDGAHNKHNEETGDNIGPLCMKRTPPVV